MQSFRCCFAALNFSSDLLTWSDLIWFVALILISHLGHKMKKSDLYKNYTLHQLLDELDVIECFEDANHSLRIGELLDKQAKIYEALGVKVPTSSC